MRSVLAVLSAALLCPLSATQAATPASGTLSLETRELSYDSGPQVYRNPSAGAVVTSEICNGAALPCDIFELTVDLPADYVAAHPEDVITFNWIWPNPVEDYDFRIFDAEGKQLTSAGTASDPENAMIGAKPGKYTIRGVPFFVAGGAYIGTIRLLSPEDAPVPRQPQGPAPEYVTLTPPAAMGNGAGEPSIGFNPKTGRLMYLAGTDTLRMTFPEKLAEPLPESCDGQWEDVSFPYTGLITADPILFTDQHSGRTFVSQMHIPVPVPPTAVGLNSLFAYTDDDGETWVPGQIGPPEGGYDHQTVGAGPYPASVPLGNPANLGSAVYYCSQAGVTAFCSRSDTGGLTFPNGFPIYDAVDDGFGGIHGHIKVADDGTVYVPVKACGEQQCVTVSEDAGITWEVRRVPGSTPGASDPSVGIAKDGSLYFCYVSTDVQPFVSVSRDKGLSWSEPYNIGAAQKIHSAVFPSAVSADPDRAACAFLGSGTGGNFRALDFPGEWHGYVATTYDGGQTWATVNVTPEKPVQRQAGIWLGGGGAQQRNLLDFNGITIDAQGRALFAYADGCVDDCELGGDNSFSEKASVARQIGGKPLFAAFDPPAAAAPGAPCLTGKRDAQVAALSWRAPAQGSEAITGYRIYKGLVKGAEVPVATIGPKARYEDYDLSLAVPSYSYRVTALNARGESVSSNTVELAVGEPVLPLPAVETTKDLNRFGGALNWLLLLPLLGGALRRR